MPFPVSDNRAYFTISKQESTILLMAGNMGATSTLGRVHSYIESVGFRCSNNLFFFWLCTHVLDLLELAIHSFLL